jgi:glycine/D-amino acid oxidase-like deaminating enzyme
MPPTSTSPWLDTVPDRVRFESLTGWVTADVAVIGGGIVGLMTAWNLAAKGQSVVLLEKNHVATGDTGLTTAFLTRVPDTAAAELLTKHGAAWLTRLFAATADAQRWFKELVRRESIACDLVDCVSYNCAYEATDAGLASEWAALRQASAGASLVTGADGAQCSVPSIQAAIRFEDEARFHVRKLVFGLLDRPAARRIQVFEETEVTRVDVDDPVVVQTSRGSILCRAVVCATGMPIDAFSELRDLVSPVLTFALAARYRNLPPMSDNLFWDTGEPYQYFRLFDDRTVILGGCDRPASARGDAPHAKLRSFLDARLSGPYDITHEWSGTLFDTVDGLPYVAAHPHYAGRVFVATGFGGNGMVMGTMAGRILADLVTRSTNAHAALFDFSRTGVTIRKPGSAAPAAATAAPEFVAALPSAQLTAGQPRVVKVKDRSIALFRIDESVYAIDNACTHAGGPLAEGDLAGTVVTCPLHGSRFDVKTGAVCAGPASRPQRRYQVRVTGDVIEVEV